MIDYIINNKEWIFSGAGVTVLLLLGTMFINRNKNINEEFDVFGVARPYYKPLISLYSIIPNPILRWRFKEARLNTLMNIDVRPRGGSIRLNLGELPDCQVWIQLVNHSPFDLDVESIKGELIYNGCNVRIETKDHVDVPKHTTRDSILLDGILTGEQANHCSKDNKYSSLTLRARIRTKFGVFKKQTGDLQSLHIEIINKREMKEEQ